MDRLKKSKRKEVYLDPKEITDKYPYSGFTSGKYRVGESQSAPNGNHEKALGLVCRLTRWILPGVTRCQPVETSWKQSRL